MYHNIRVLHHDKKYIKLYEKIWVFEVLQGDKIGDKFSLSCKTKSGGV